MSERDELVARLRDVTEDDAYEAPWTFGVHCRAAAAQIERDGREIERLRRVLSMCRGDPAAMSRAALNGEGET